VNCHVDPHGCEPQRSRMGGWSRPLKSTHTSVGVRREACEGQGRQEEAPADSKDHSHCAKFTQGIRTSVDTRGSGAGTHTSLKENCMAGRCGSGLASFSALAALRRKAE
jgi:hypothetical protein